MQTSAITSYIDVAQVTLYVFWAFFAGLIIYLRREDKREGYPLISDRNQHGDIVEGFPPMPAAKTFLLPHGGTQIAPRVEAPEVFKAVPGAVWPGAPYVPTGNPMTDAVGPASYARRADVPDMTFDDNLPKIVPLRAAADFFLAGEDPDPRGMDVVGADDVIAGTVVDVWIDRSEVTIRYLEVALTDTAGGARVLLPMNFSQLHSKLRQVRVRSILGEQFSGVPVLRNPDVVTLLEEDMIMAYYGGGTLYATLARLGPVL